jgi:hypothetical protein
MRKIFITNIILAGTILAYAQNTHSTNQTKEIKKIGTIHLTKAVFLSKVANYEKKPTE